MPAAAPPGSRSRGSSGSRAAYESSRSTLTICISSVVDMRSAQLRKSVSETAYERESPASPAAMAAPPPPDACAAACSPTARAATPAMMALPMASSRTESHRFAAAGEGRAAGSTRHSSSRPNAPASSSAVARPPPAGRLHERSRRGRGVFSRHARHLQVGRETVEDAAERRRVEERHGRREDGREDILVRPAAGSHAREGNDDHAHLWATTSRCEPSPVMTPAAATARAQMTAAAASEAAA